MAATTPVVEILAIGDELVHGSSLDTNSAYMARELEALGFAVRGFTVTTDEPGALREAIETCCGRAQLVLATGGLGPTEDDRTRAAAASAAGVELHFDAASWQHIAAMFEARSLTPPESNRVQAELPVGAEVLRNDWGSAPGFALAVGGALFISLPGVPREMKAMLEARVLPLVQQRFARPGALAFHQMHAMGLQEAALGERLAELMRPDCNPRVGITAHYGLHTVRLVAHDESDAAARAQCAAAAERIRPLLGEHLVYEGAGSIAELVGSRLMETGTTLALAESCTGGLVASQLTGVSGISAVFLAGLVTYSDAAKKELLGVPAGMLEEYGAVSTEVAGAMAEGAASRTGARLGASITGVAGPAGGTEEKPVGTVCFGLSQDGEIEVWRRRFPDLGRTFIRERAALELFAGLHRRLAREG